MRTKFKFKQIFLFSLYLLSLLIWPLEQVRAEWMQGGDLKEKFKASVFRRDSLTREQMTDVEQIQKDLSEVDPSSLQEWVDDFRRDLDPDRQIALWKHIAKVYVSTVKGRDLPRDYKKDVFGLLLTCSTAPREKSSTHLILTVLSQEEANAIMDEFYAGDFEPLPITVTKPS